MALVITVRNSSCRKVMFLRLSVSHSVHRGIGGGVHLPRQTPPRQTPPRANTPPPPHQEDITHKTATAADSTHPTGMHSWLDKVTSFACHLKKAKRDKPLILYEGRRYSLL